MHNVCPSAQITPLVVQTMIIFLYWPQGLFVLFIYFFLDNCYAQYVINVSKLPSEHGKTDKIFDIRDLPLLHVANFTRTPRNTDAGTNDC